MPVYDSLLAVLVRLVQFRQQGLEHFGVVDQLRSTIDSERKIELGQIPSDFTADSSGRDVRDIREPVYKCFCGDCEAGVREDECAKKGIRGVEMLQGWRLEGTHMRIVLMTVFRFRMIARKSWVN